ncbi:MAG: GNAT family N-acetyltransferase, partial [bacterium]
YRTEGLASLLKSGFTKLSQFIFTSNHAMWFKRDLGKRIVASTTQISVYVEFEKRNKTLQWIKSLGKEWMYNNKEIDTAIKENHIIASVNYQKKIIGYIKLGFNKVFIQDFQKVISFSPEKAFIYDTYVLPEFRGLGVAPYLITESMKYIKKKGFHQLVCHIPIWNTASINAYKKVGFEAVKDIRFAKILGLRLFSSRPEKI